MTHANPARCRMRMWRAPLLLLAVACAPPLTPTPDSGLPPHDSGTPDAGRRACVASTCDVGGTWQVSYTVIAAPTLGYCAATQEPLRLASDGGSVCMPNAAVGSTDGGCTFSFEVERDGFDWVGTERWEVQLLDAGVLEGTWKVQMQFPACSSAYAIRATR